MNRLPSHNNISKSSLGWIWEQLKLVGSVATSIKWRQSLDSDRIHWAQKCRLGPYQSNEPPDLHLLPKSYSESEYLNLDFLSEALEQAPSHINKYKIFTKLWRARCSVRISVAGPPRTKDSLIRRTLPVAHWTVWKIFPFFPGRPGYSGVCGVA